MTREEAIETLQIVRNVQEDTSKLAKALDIAIQAIEWQYSEMLVLCDNCGHAIHVKFEDEKKEMQNEHRQEIELLYFDKGYEQGQMHLLEKIDKIRAEISDRLGLLDCKKDILAIIDKYIGDTE